jgi:cysteine synthase A
LQPLGPGIGGNSPRFSPPIRATIAQHAKAFAYYSPGSHPIQGIGAGFIPKNLHTDVLDGTIQVSKEEGFEYALRSAKEEGIFVGISSGAALAAVAKKLPEVPAGSRILTFCYDTGERYLSIEGLFA